MSTVLAADIGGGHISAAAVDLANGALLPGMRTESAIDSSKARDVVLDAWAACLNEVLARSGARAPVGIAFAMPGPFDYRTGTGLFEATDKYESLRDVVVPDLLIPRLDKSLEMRFINDAAAFGIGEAWKLFARRSTMERIIAVTLGTGFGSAFLDRGFPVATGPSVPLHGVLWHLPFQEGIFDDFISSRWLRSQFAAISDEPVSGVREIAEIARNDGRYAELFHRYGKNLGIAVAEWIERFEAQALILGGNVARAFDLFSESLRTVLAQRGVDAPIIVAESTDEAAIRGAAV